MISLRHGGREFLWHDPDLLDDAFRPRVPVAPAPAGATMSAWQNWGGDKSWPAPQAAEPSEDGWHGPPDPVLDGGAYVVEARREREVRLRSRFDLRTGLQQTRSITLDDTGARVVTTITNCSARVRRFAPWEVMQVALAAEDEAGAAVVEVERADGAGQVLDLGTYSGAPTTALRGPTALVRPGAAVAKLGFPAATGRVRCRFADGAGLDLVFAAETEAPDGAPFQLWLQTPVDAAPPGLGGWRPAHRLMELEPVGALRELPPGGSASLEATWTLSPPTGGPAPDRA